MEKKNNKIIIILMGVIIVILAVLCVLFATNTITFNHQEIKNEIENQENTSIKEDKNIDDDSNQKNNGQDSNNSYTRDYYIQILKNNLMNDEWVKNNLYAKKNCFNEAVQEGKQDFRFYLLNDNNGNPMLVVSSYNAELFINREIKVYFNSERKIEIKELANNHPSHGGAVIDSTRGLMETTYFHMGDYSRIIYDIKGNEMEKIDSCSCKYTDAATGCDCNITVEFDASESFELTRDNINEYIK